MKTGNTAVTGLPCLCGSLRKAARALTQVYEDALRPTGLKSSQLTILQVLARMGELSQGQLGEVLAMDSTTLTRTLAIMVRAGWVAERRGEDRRERRLRLAKGGEALLRRALPLWEKVQTRLRRQAGERTWNDLLEMTNRITGLAK